MYRLQAVGTISIHISKSVCMCVSACMHACTAQTVCEQRECLLRLPRLHTVCLTDRLLCFVCHVSLTRGRRPNPKRERYPTNSQSDDTRFLESSIMEYSPPVGGKTEPPRNHRPGQSGAHARQGAVSSIMTQRSDSPPPRTVRSTREAGRARREGATAMGP